LSVSLADADFSRPDCKGPLVSDAAQLTELITVRDYLRFATSRFREAGLAFGHGTASALDDAAFLILETLHLPIDSLDPWLDARLTRAERTQLAAVIEQRVVTRKPSAYITCSAYLGPYKFYVDERVIVPRSFLGELLLGSDDDGSGLPFGLDAPPQRVLDMCTGSGCLAIVAAHIFPAATVTAVDISDDALAVARGNIASHKLAARVTAQSSNLFASVGGGPFDLILCNPPYVSADTVARFPAEHKSEPELAHLGGADGMDLVRRLLAQAGPHLTPDGLLVVEVGQGRETLERDYPALPFLWLDTVHSEAEVFALPASAIQVEMTAAPKRARPPAKKAPKARARS
jgi:ribosomal protein L3 glutamine methyltransferase